MLEGRWKGGGSLMFRLCFGSVSVEYRFFLVHLPNKLLICVTTKYTLKLFAKIMIILELSLSLQKVLESLSFSRLLT